MKSQFLLIGILLLGLSGCVSVVRLPSSTGQVPRVNGRLGGVQAGMDFSSSVDVTVIKDLSTTPPDRSEILVGRGDLFSSLFLMAGSGMDFSVGLTENVDLYYTRNLGLRWMFWGDSKSAGWKSTVFAGPVSSSSTTSYSSGATENKSETKISGMEYGVSVGNEVGSDTLIYLTLASRGGDADITVTQTAGNTYKYADTYTHQIATLGLTTGKAWYLKLELSVNTVNWDGKKDVAGTQKVSDSGSYGGGTFGFGYRW